MIEVVILSAALHSQTVALASDGQWYIVPEQETSPSVVEKVDFSTVQQGETVAPMKGLEVTTKSSKGAMPLRWIVHFQTGSATVDTADSERLKDLAHRYTVFRVEAHADQRGPDALNKALSQKRAEAVAQILRQAGAKQVAVAAFGAERPLCTESTETCHAKNRRAEVRGDKEAQ